MIVYKITNLINGRVYIGFTIYPLQARRKIQLDEANRATSGFLYSALVRYGKQNFRWTLLTQCQTKSEAYKHREWYIKQYNSMNRRYGYNCQSGGYNFSLAEDSKEKTRKSHLNLPEHLKIKISNAIKKAQTGVKESAETCKKMSIAKTGKNHPMFGKHHTAEAKKNMSIVKSGENHPMFGKHHTDKTKQKISEAQKGKIISLATRNKIIKTKTGSHASDEAKKNMSIAKSGKNHPMFGKHHTDEARKNMSIGQKKRYSDPKEREKTSIAAKNRKRIKKCKMKKG